MVAWFLLVLYSSICLFIKLIICKIIAEYIIIHVAACLVRVMVYTMKFIMFTVPVEHCLVELSLALVAHASLQLGCSSLSLE